MKRGRRIVGAGLTAQLTARASFFIAYDGEYGAGASNQRVTGGFGLWF